MPLDCTFYYFRANKSKQKMKTKLIKSLPLLVLILLVLGCGKYGGSYTNLSDYTGYGNGARKFGVTVWTNSENTINVFVNGQQIGIISQKYDQAPECGSAGCVYYDTEDGGIKITIRGESVDGKIKWEEKSLRLNRDCRKVEFIKNSDGTPDILVN
ncbi:MAG: hypothetical protein D4R64_04120 [Porphyromonadaceae bacterium]|nr:MAG: hypothetical protein D4R64_04120 [Porphyromonadaceae bacterium]